MNIKRSIGSNYSWISVLTGLLLCFTISCNQSKPEVKQLTAQTAPSETKVVTLADGSVITLNQKTELKYPSVFTGKDRRVTLNGEAHFEVVASPTSPFVIATPSSEVTALGTIFNLKDGSKSNALNIAVQEGQVQVQPKGKSDHLLLNTNEQGIYLKKAHQMKKAPLTNLNAFAWKTQKLVYNGAPIKVVMSDLLTLYKAQLYFENFSMLDCPFTGSFEKQSVDEIIEVLSKTFGMEVIKARQSYRLKGGACK